MCVETDLHLAGQGATVFYSQFDYRPQRSCGKVMFLHVSAILSMGGVCQDTPIGRHKPPRQTLPSHTHSPGKHPPVTVTAADGTHPTGMHSCAIICLKAKKNPISFNNKQAIKTKSKSCICIVVTINTN